LDDLSNWYVRRNRRRFWRTKGGDDRDKLAAYQTLYESLLTFVKLLAPVIPFLTERLYQNLRLPGDPESVHLCDFPEAPTGSHSAIDQRLSEQMSLLREITRVSLSLRSGTGIRVRQPLANLRLSTQSDDQRSGIEHLSTHLLDELNVKQIEFGEINRLNDGWLHGEALGVQVALDGRVTPELEREGWARDVVRHIQQLRKQTGLEVSDRIELTSQTEHPELAQAIAEWSDYIQKETLAVSLNAGSVEDGHVLNVGPSKAELRLSLRKA
ncbi:MAG: DUF5915 domain-containing protein, partial [Acidimicrobiia bacterium]